MKPIISVNILCYNRSVMLRECIESFIKQTFKDFEIIVVDDGSEEDLSFVIDMDSRVKYFKQEHLGEGPRGIAAGFNLALDKSSGKYVLPFGSDDLALPNLLLKLLKIVNGSDIAYCDNLLRRYDGSESRRKYSNKITYKEMLEKQIIAHSGTLWLKDNMPRYDETLGAAEDWELFLEALENGLSFKHIAERLWIYRTGHLRESNTQRVVDGCCRVMSKRKYYFDKKLRRGFPL